MVPKCVWMTDTVTFDRKLKNDNIQTKLLRDGERKTKKKTITRCYPGRSPISTHISSVNCSEPAPCATSAKPALHSISR